MVLKKLSSSNSTDSRNLCTVIECPSGILVLLLLCRYGCIGYLKDKCHYSHGHEGNFLYVLP